MRAAVSFSKEETSLWGIPASLLFHALLVVALLLSPAAPKLMQVPDSGVAVEILTPQQFHAAVDPKPQPVAPPQPEASVPAMPKSAALPQAAKPEPVPEAASGMIVAKTMLSEKTLADPRSGQARRELATFADSERIVQLCNLEAMDQVEAWRSDFHPDRLVAYARSDVKMSGETIVADGAAFRSRNRWHDIRFKCQVTPDHAKVAAFEFQVGEPVPRKDWEELNLPAVH
jgi:hypothetical protein